MGLSAILTHISYKRFRATIITDIWLETTFFSLVATMVCLVSKFRVNLGISNGILTVLGTVLGLVLSFRTSSAYERYQEGRKLWTSVTLASRNLATLIWVQVPNERPLKAGEPEVPGRNRALETILEKKSMINLVLGFAIALKHLLRGEKGIFYEDLYPLISFLPKYAAHAGCGPDDCLPVWVNSGAGPETIISGQKGSRSSTPFRPKPRHKRSEDSDYDPEKALPSVASEVELQPARIPPHDTIYEHLPFLLIFKPFVSLFVWVVHRRRHSADERLTFAGKRRKPAIVDSNIPLEINLFLSTYFSSLMKQALLTPAAATAFMNNLTLLQDSCANLERVRNTPLPFAYQAHLRMCMWMYLFFLPFQIYSTFQYLTIPATAFTAFLLLGFLEIGQQIEDPFGYYLNDLPVDDICLAIERELHEITAHPAPEPHSYVFSQFNQPFAPTDRRTADEILSNVQHEYYAPDTGMGSVHRTLLKNWRDVNRFTRH